MLRSEQSALLRVAVLNSSLSTEDRLRLEGACQWLEAVLSGRVEANWRAEADLVDRPANGPDGNPWMRTDTDPHPDEPLR